MNKLNTFIVLAIGAVLGVFGFLYAIHGFHNLHITAVFEELEPFRRNINVYYKGFKLGKTVRVYPSKDFTCTNVDIILRAKNLNLPDNITAKIKRKDKKDYIEIDYPDRPSVTYIKNHSKIEGVKGESITDFINRQAEGGGLDEIKENLNTTVESAGHTLDALTELVHTANDILKDLRPALKTTGDNLATASGNLVEVTNELQSSTGENRLRNSFSSIEQTTKNLELATSNFANVSQKADAETVAIVNCALKNTNTVIRNINQVVININDIVKGIKSTLSKNFASMRLIFGKPLS